MKSNVLIVDDNEEIIDLLSDILLDEEYNIFSAKNSDEALEKIKFKPDIILLDIMMPGKDGFEFCREIRNFVNCPIVFITAKIEEEDILKGLALGGDDYIKKPFNIKEVKARVAAHLRRDKRNLNIEKNYIIFDNLKIDLGGREIIYKGNNIGLTKREFDIIELLAFNRGQVFTKEQIYEKIWGYDAEGDASTVSEHIKKIRAKFVNEKIEFQYISTVWGVGYKWNNESEGIIR